MVCQRLICLLMLVCVVTALPQRAGVAQAYLALKGLGYQHNNIGPTENPMLDRYSYNGDPMSDSSIIPGEMNNYGKYSYGCRDGHCWVQCESVFVISSCWATPPGYGSLSQVKMSCNEHTDCTNRVKCATPCLGI